MKVPLSKIAHTRSGDKGDTCNIGVITYDARHYPVLVRELTPERVKSFFGDLVHGKVEHQVAEERFDPLGDRKSTRLNSSHVKTSYAVFCLKKKKNARKSAIN